MAFEMKEEDCRTHLNSLHHGLETEIRIMGTKQMRPENKKERFCCYGQDRIIETLKRYNPLKNAYVGINERWHGGSKIVDVSTINAVYGDIEAKDHSKKGKHFALELAEQIRNDLKKENIRMGLADSGNGYHILISLDKPIPIDCPEEKGNITRLQAKDYYKRIKVWAGKQTTQHAKCDPVIYNIACAEKIIGSYSHSAKQVSFWIDKPPITKTENFLKWVQKMPKQEVSVNDGWISNSVELLPQNCGLMRHILTHRVPRSEADGGKVRYHYVAPSVSAFTRHLKNRAEVRLAWEELQEDSGSYVGCLAGWDKIKTKFNCTALRSFAREVGWDKMCAKCLMEAL